MARMRKSTVVLTSFLSLAGATIAATSAGQSPPKTATADTSNSAEAARHYEEGVKAAKSERWNKAHEEFLAAWKLKQHYQIAANLGRAELQIGKYRDAAEHLAYFLREAPNVDGAERAAAQAMLDKARAKVGALRVGVNPEGAEISIDGVPVGKSPLPHEVFVEPGSRTFAARLKGYAPAEVSLDVAAGSSHQVVLRLVENPTAERRQPSLVPAATTGEGGPNKGILIGGMAATAIAAGVGAVFAIVSESAATEQERVDRMNASFWSFIASGALGTGTLVYALLAPWSEPKSGTKDVRVSVAGAGIKLTTSW